MKFVVRPFPFFLLACLTTMAHAAEAQPTPDELISAAKLASGGTAWDKIVTWHEKGKVIAGGLTGSYDSWVDLTNLSNSGSFALGPATGTQGWDGKEAWSTDSSKEVRVEASAEAIAGAIQDSYRSAYGFYFPDRFPAERAARAVPRTADGKTYLAVKITPKGADPFEVWFDPTTHLIAREVQLTGAQPHAFYFTDYAPTGGIMAPRKIIDRIADNPKFDTILVSESIEFAGPQEISLYAPPPPPKDSAQWPAGQDSVTFPFRLINNHIHVRVAINGQMVPFMFDTGATNVLADAAAKPLGIKLEGELPGGGFGDNLSSSALAKVKSVSLGGLTLPDQVFITEGTGWVAAEGTPLDGLVGYEFVKRAVLTIDYAKGEMTFTKPSQFHPPAGVTPIPFTFSAHIPMLPGTLDGVPGEFELDTGSRGALTIMMPFAEANGLVAREHATVTGTIGYGVGGPIKALLGRGGKFTLGSVSVEGPITEFVLNHKGAGNETHTAGNIGGDILKRFTVTLDYGNRLVYLQPNAANNTPEVFDRSGLWLARAADGTIEIADVTTSSASAKLGLVSGDEILSVNGKPTTDVELYDLRTDFKGAVGTSFALKVKTKSGEKSVTLVLADQV